MLFVQLVLNTNKHSIAILKRWGNVHDAVTKTDKMEWITESDTSLTTTYGDKMRPLVGTFRQFLSTGLYYDSRNDIIKLKRSNSFLSSDCLIYP